VRILGEVLGRELRFEGLTNEQARAELEATMPTQYVAAFLKFYVDGDLDEAAVLPTVATVLAASPTTFGPGSPRTPTRSAPAPRRRTDRSMTTAEAREELEVLAELRDNPRVP